MRLEQLYPWFRKLLVVLGTVLVVSAGVLVVYSVHLRHSAKGLVVAAQQIRSASDASRQLEYWRRKGMVSSESRSPDQLGRAYQVELSNKILSSLRLVPHTVLLLQVSTRGDELDGILLGMYTKNSSVWVQEDFTSVGTTVPKLHLERSRERTLSKALLQFKSDMGASEQQRRFGLNPLCLVKVPFGCRNAEEMLPGVLRLETGLSNQRPR